MPRLLSTNLEAMKQHIHIDGFPSSFIDAFEVAVLLGIEYVWIDALCIIQNDSEDWKREAEKMGDVYRFGYCNLAAHAAADRADVGLFLERNPRDIMVHTGTVARKEFIRKFFISMERRTDGISSSSLMRRGWVLQERLLSPRTVFFAERLQWGCSELQACEKYPEGPPAIPSYSPWGADGTPLRINNLLFDEHRYQGRLKILHMYRKWLVLARWYSACQLTYQQDFFPALSRLAKYFQAALKDIYVAGLWKGDLMHGLLWIHVGDGEPENPLVEYIAPSWSWASVKGKVLFFIAEDPDSSKYDEVWVAEVIEIVLNTLSSDPMCRIENGKLTVSGHVRKSRPFFETFELYSSSCCRNWADRRPPFDFIGLTGELFYFLLGYKYIFHKNGAREVKELYGLLLEATGQAENEYRRVGSFQHEWVHELQPETGEYPIFVDLDLMKLNTVTITIV
ncbi:HET-domain-containing protein [Byssothecium circinans]|uniref:HET-domain-containing protein n=1 Tax=Byssothecium circinans TaxID=147558 RepID=A0A6A5UFR9_9PLEO|nr:HET-domain-containing protein [Byssothecium circinans]